VADEALLLPADLVDFLQSGIAILVGTRDALLQPATLRAMGASVGPSRSALTIYLPAATGTQTIANLRDNGHVAVTFSRSIDHRSIQVKGRITLIRESDEADRGVQARYIELFAESLALIGLRSGSSSASTTGRASRWRSK
jgi:general stress protein 26